MRLLVGLESGVDLGLRSLGFHIRDFGSQEGHVTRVRDLTPKVRLGRIARPLGRRRHAESVVDDRDPRLHCDASATWLYLREVMRRIKLHGLEHAHDDFPRSGAPLLLSGPTLPRSWTHSLRLWVHSGPTLPFLLPLDSSIALQPPHPLPRVPDGEIPPSPDGSLSPRGSTPAPRRSLRDPGRSILYSGLHPPPDPRVSASGPWGGERVKVTT